MSSATIGRLRVKIGSDSAGLEKGLARARAQIRAVGAAGVAAFTAVGVAALSGASDIDQTAKSARRLDASIGAYEALKLAAGDAGVSLSSVTNDIQSMNREIASIGKSGNADRALKQLGLDAADFAGLDVDERIARIADRVVDLGLDAGETTSVLRDLGVRNREMALLMLQGGDAIRTARKDVEDYGLALSSVDAAKIEAANDKISRLGNIGRYVGQQLALALVPAMGNLAQEMSNSLREGGALRGLLDGMVGSLGRVSAYLSAIVAGFGIRYVGALAAARLATLSLVGSLTVLRGALIRTGVGALVIGAGELIYQFTRLVGAAGSFGGAMSLLGDVGQGLWQKLGDGATFFIESFRAASLNVQAFFLNAFRKITGAFVELTWTIANGLNSVLGTSLSGVSAVITQDLARGYLALTDAANSASSAATAAAENFGSPLKSWGALKQVVADAKSEFGELGDAGSSALSAISDAADGGGGSGGGGSGGKGAVEAVKKVKDAAAETNDTLSGLESASKNAFSGLIKGTHDLKDALGEVLGALADVFINSAFSQVWSGGLGGVFGGLIGGLGVEIPGYANGTKSHPGGLAWVGERGKELLNLPRGAKVTSNSDLRAAAGSTAGLNLQVHAAPNPYFDIRVEQVARPVAAATTLAGMQVQRQSLGDRSNDHQLRYR